MSIIRFSVAIIVAAVVAAAVGQEKAQTTSPAATASAPRPATKPYVCHRAGGTITIDDKDHPDEWRRAEVIRDWYEPVTNQPARSKSEIRMLWDDECLYMHFVLYDLDLRGTRKKRTEVHCDEDIAELVLRPVADKRSYYEFEVNPANSWMALQVADMKKGGLVERSAWEPGLRTAVHVEGTVNDPTDRDKLFRVVMAVPWKNLALAEGKTPKVGEAWSFHGSRYDYSNYLPTSPELSSTVGLSAVNFHLLDEFAPLKFAE